MSRVLIVDDEASICWAFGEYLGDLGHQVDVAGRAQIAPGIDGETADQDKIDLRLAQAFEKDAEAKGMWRHRGRAAPVKVERNSLSARPSARFSARERPASSRQGQWSFSPRSSMATNLERRRARVSGFLASPRRQMIA